MTKEILLKIRGLQMLPDMDADAVEVLAPGEYYYRNDKHFFLYEEVSEGFSTTTKNLIKVMPDYMELTKKGLFDVHMVFEKNKKNVTYYYTPYGSLLVGIDATKVSVEENEQNIQVDVEYNLEINYEHVAKCHISMEALSKGNDGQEYSSGGCALV